MNNEEKIIQKLVEIDEKVTNIGVQTTELMEFKDYTTNILDKHSAILERLDQEG